MSIRFSFLSSVLLVLCTAWAACGQSYTISTIAGGSLPVNIPGTSANLFGPQSVAVDTNGNIFFADDQNDVLRLDAKMGILSLVAGNGTPGFSGDDGLATSAQLNQPQGVAVDAAGNLYIADAGNNRIRKVSNGVIATIAGNGVAGFGGDNGPAASAELNNPTGVAVDSIGNLYIADPENNRVRKIAAQNSVITTVAGIGPETPLPGSFGGDGGPATSASLDSPLAIAVDTAGNLYIADVGNARIREVSGGVITTVAGNGMFGFSGDDGPASGAELQPSGIAVDAAGNLYIDDRENLRIRKVSAGVITTVAGSGGTLFSGDNGPAIGAQLDDPFGVAVNSTGELYIADTENSRIRKVSNGVITTVAGGPGPYFGGFAGDNGAATGAELHQPTGVAVDAAGNLFIADTGNGRIRKVSGGIITTVAGNGQPVSSPTAGDNGPATSAQLNSPSGVAVDSADNFYIADPSSGRVRKVSAGMITTVAGNGTFGFSGDNGPATSAKLSGPSGVAVDTAGNLYIADTGNQRIRKVSNGTITTVAGNGTKGFSGDNGPAANAELDNPYAVAVDSAGNLYIADSSNNRIRKVANGTITTIAGNGMFSGSFAAFGGDGGPATGAGLSDPGGIAVSATGNVYIADSTNYRIRILTPGIGPALNPGGIVPVNSAVSAIQPGSWVSIFGTNLATGTVLWNGDFPTSLGGVSVNIDNKPAYLWFVSPDQLNLQAPDDGTTGTVSVAVTTPSGTTTSTVTLASFAPSFSLLGDGRHVAGEIATPNDTGAYANGTYDLVGPRNTFSYSTRPVNPGETLTLYGVGFGPTTPHVPGGQVFSGSAPTSNKVTVTIGGMNANVVYSGITEAGLYQVNLVVPANTGSGDQPLQAIVNGVPTPRGPVVTVQ